MDNLSLSKDHYEKMVNLTHELLCISDLDGQFRYVNHAFEVILGYSPSEIDGLNLHTILHPDDLTVLKRELQPLLMENRDTLNFEMRIRCKDGTYKWIAWNIRIDRTEKLVYSSGRDTTEKKHTEEALILTKERLLEAQEFAHVGHWELDIISGDFLWSDEMFRIGDFRPQEFIPDINFFANSIHPDDKEFVLYKVDELLSGNECECECDFRIIRQDNGIKWVHGKARHGYDSNGVLVRIYGVVQDITRRKLSEIEQKKSEEKFKELADNLAQVIWVRQEEELFYVNPAYEEIWGRTCQSLYDNPNSFIEFIHPDDQERVKQAYIGDRCISKGLFDEQFKIIRPDGGIRWVWDRTLPIYNENGKITRVLGIGDDITEIKEYQESLIQAKEDAETANKVKSQFLANMSHEIRTPMNGILGIAQLLVMNLKGENKELASIIKSSGDDLLKIIDDILDLSRIEAGKVRLSQEEFDINILVNDVNKVIETLVKQKGLTYKSYIDRAIGNHLIGDPDRLKQVLFNLLGNAIKFTEQGSVELSIAKGKVIEDKVQLIFSVNDSGIGIADDKVGQLFTYFTQGDDSVTKKYGGTGLGLAISKQLINLMDGEISVEGQLGVGSNFVFSTIFKLKDNKKEVLIDGAKDVPSVVTSNSTVLLVEDDYVSGMVIKMFCERKDINLKIAANGNQAIEMLKAESFDLIFMDIQMPDISGYDATKIIREMERKLNKHTIIVATTAFALVGDKEKCIDAGMDDYLGKPIDAEKFYSILEKWVKNKTKL